MLLRLVKLFGVLTFVAALSLAQQADSQFFEAHGVQIHYLEQGAGEPVILIHGWYSSARINWALPGTMAVLAKDHRVIALDLPGYGQSAKPRDASAYGRQWVEDIALLLDHLHLTKAHIVGYSMGGMVALKFISQHPERVLSGVLGGMGWMPEGGSVQKMWARMKDPASRGVAQLALAQLELQAIAAPVEVLVGSEDPARKLYVAPLQAVRKDWPVIEIQGAGHLNCIAKDQFKQELAKWIAAHPATTLSAQAIRPRD